MKQSDTADAVWISYHINKLLTETETKTREKKSMKPKVQWRCLKTDAPEPSKRYWFAGGEGSVEALWVNKNGKPPTGNSGTVENLLDCNWTHWAPYEAPEPPPKPTPFEAWWNKMPDPRYVGGDFRDVNTDIGTHVTNREVAKACFLAGYEACAKNMASGGVK